jgi:hypothetical protein
MSRVQSKPHRRFGRQRQGFNMYGILSADQFRGEDVFDPHIRAERLRRLEIYASDAAAGRSIGYIVPPEFCRKSRGNHERRTP